MHVHSPQKPAFRRSTIPAICADKKLRRAREALKKAQEFEAEKVELPDSLCAQANKATAAQSVETADVVDVAAVETSRYVGPTIKVTLPYQHLVRKEGKCVIKIRRDQPLRNLVDEFDSRRNGCEVSALKFEGGNVDLRKALAFYDMGDDNLVDAVDRGPRRSR